MSDVDLTIYLIDDDDGVRLALERGLSRKGFTVLAFASAATFLEVYEESQAGCIVVDRRMPEMTGLELQRHLINLGDRTPIIFMSGNVDPLTSEQVMQAGAVGFLEKPFRQSALVELVESALASTVTSQENCR